MRSKNGFKDKELVFKLFKTVESGVSYKEFVETTGFSVSTYYRIKNAIEGKDNCPQYYKSLFKEYKDKNKKKQKTLDSINKALKQYFNFIKYDIFSGLFKTKK